MLDEKFNLKLVDFGFSTCVFGKDGQGFLSTTLGTPSYMAPEIHEKRAYTGMAVDVYASGVILFILISGHPPCRRGILGDYHYKMFCHSRDSFWKVQGKNKPPNFYSSEFKELMNSMLEYDSSKRFGISEIKASAWYNGPRPS